AYGSEADVGETARASELAQVGQNGVQRLPGPNLGDRRVAQSVLELVRFMAAALLFRGRSLVALVQVLVQKPAAVCPAFGAGLLVRLEKTVERVRGVAPAVRGLPGVSSTGVGGAEPCVRPVQAQAIAEAIQVRIRSYVGIDKGREGRTGETKVTKSGVGIEAG